MKKKRSFTEGYKTYDTSTGYGNANEWQRDFHFRMSGEEAAKIVSDQPQTPLEILGLFAPATQEQIKSAFKKLIMFWHPDRNSDPEAEAMSKKIIAAYTILKR